MSPTGELKSKGDTVTVVLNAVTGVVTAEHSHFLLDGIQLTDSAILDGTTVYSLSDGSKLWDVRDLKVEGDTDSSNFPNIYAGAGGHSTFILSTSHDGHMILASDEKSSEVIKVPPLVGDTDAVHNGWGVIEIPTESQRSPSDRTPKLHNRQVQAANIDALAGVPGTDTQVYDLGTSAGLNKVASRASNTLVTLPPLPPEESNTNHSDYSAWRDGTAVGMVFDPRSQAVTTADQTPGLPAASVGVTQVSSGEEIEGQITLRPGDGSPGLSIPLAPGSTFRPPGNNYYNPHLKDLAIAGDRSESFISAVSTPGATVVTLRTDPDNQVAQNRIRLYGTPGGPR